ncbi:putative translation initiation factor eIF-2B subunit delta [Cyphellophora attinorum]|uniref:Translation initiation factor eIF2B subunit delta n=1 Tax=Cyphellophora attinorum TaxID=1664694 RepID=A0A0N0NLE0_9EURO|nr:putative translation initiation factor eIF-2B subunit delta [Phialophora attinorum]KPI39068.1 putative translation initiation factor eIF-2B subunit delta [Phialophora attinorum]
MADDTTPTKSATLDPSAPVFTMPPEKTDSQPLTNGTKKPEPSQNNAGGPATTTKASAPDTASDGKLTPAQLKKKKAEEKAARRAEKVAAKGPSDTAGPAGPAQPTAQPAPPVSSNSQQRRPSVGSKQNSTEPSSSQSHHRRTASSTGRPLPIRQAAAAAPTAATFQPPKDEKRLNMVSHLRTSEERLTLSSANREIHPAILSLALQLRDYVICGANARCIALLLAFKKVISSYTTPSREALSRHLLTHLGHQISYINHARQLGVSQGNAIRWLKKLVSTIDVGIEDRDAREFLCGAIDQYIREKITLADEVIARDASQRIEDGDVVLTYGKSSVVERTLLEAYSKRGKRFSVIVADSRPMFEGKNLARSLIRAGIKVSYCLLSSLGDVVEQATKCMLGAAAMLGNGRLSARAGTALVAMMVKESSSNSSDGGISRGKVPVMVLAESHKFTSKVALDSIMLNELGHPDALIEGKPSTSATAVPTGPEKESKGGKGKKGGSSKEEPEVEEKEKRGLDDWREKDGLYLLNLMYDVTPADYLDVVISELGSLPPSAVMGVIRVGGGEEYVESS